jgi:hypothetical protein
VLPSVRGCADANCLHHKVQSLISMAALPAPTSIYFDMEPERS